MNMDASKRDAIDKIKEILSEHFEKSVLVVEYEISDKQDFIATAFYHGGLTAAIGLLEIGKRDLLKEDNTDQEF